ncbi:hypothetical protein Tco_0002272 [Tanacetum coccineum]
MGRDELWSTWEVVWVEKPWEMAGLSFGGYGGTVFMVSRVLKDKIGKDATLAPLLSSLFILFWPGYVSGFCVYTMVDDLAVTGLGIMGLQNVFTVFPQFASKWCSLYRDMRSHPFGLSSHLMIHYTIGLSPAPIHCSMVFKIASISCLQLPWLLVLTLGYKGGGRVGDYTGGNPYACSSYSIES